MFKHVKTACFFGIIIAASASLAPFASANIMIVPPTGAAYDPSDPLGNLPPGANLSVTLNPLNVAYLAPPAGPANIFSVFAAEAATQFFGWTVVSGGALSGTLTIGEYDARDYVAEPSVGRATPRGGADMVATYARAATEPAIADLRFIQLFTDNTGANGALVSHIDPFPNDDPVGNRLPWYYTDAEHAAHSTATTMTFEDHPSDFVSSFPFFRTVQFETYLATFDTIARVATIRDGWSWGYTIPEPSSLVLLVTAIGGMLIARWRPDRLR